MRVYIYTTDGKTWELDYEDDGTEPSAVAEHYLNILHGYVPGAVGQSRSIALGIKTDQHNTSVMAFAPAEVVGVRVFV